VETLEIHELDGCRGLRLVGELDMETASSFEGALATMDGSGQCTLDLSGLSFIDSSGLHAIVRFARRENGNGRVILEASQWTLRLLEIAHLGDDPNLEIRVAG